VEGEKGRVLARKEREGRGHGGEERRGV